MALGIARGVGAWMAIRLALELELETSINLKMSRTNPPLLKTN